MGGLRVNFAEVEGGFDPLPEGKYPCIVERLELRESKSSDNYYINWEFVVQDEEHEDRRLWKITTVGAFNEDGEMELHPHPFVQSQLKDDFVACGVDEEDEIELEWADDTDITPSEGPIITNPDVTGAAVDLYVKNEMWDGRERNRVERMEAPGAGEVVKSNGDSAKPARTKKGTTTKSRSRAKKPAASGGRRKLR